MKNYNDIKESLQSEVKNRDELHEEVNWMVHDKLTTEEILEIAQNKELLQKSPTSYQSAHNEPIIDIIAEKIGNELKRDIEVE